MSKRNSTTVRVATGRVRKHTLTFAHRIIKVLTSDKTPEKTRRALRRALQNLFDHTDIGGRASLTHVDTLALVLCCTGPQRIKEGKEYMRAFKARIAFCDLLHEYERQSIPQLRWVLGLVKASHQPHARRANRTPKAAATSARRAVAFA